MNKWLGVDRLPVGSDVLYKDKKWKIIRKGHGWITLKRWSWFRPIVVNVREAELF